jgi:hypothetical protein
LVTSVFFEAEMRRIANYPAILSFPAVSLLLLMSGGCFEDHRDNGPDYDHHDDHPQANNDQHGGMDPGGGPDQDHH